MRGLRLAHARSCIRMVYFELLSCETKCESESDTITMRRRSDYDDDYYYYYYDHQKEFSL